MRRYTGVEARALREAATPGARDVDARRTRYNVIRLPTGAPDDGGDLLAECWSIGDARLFAAADGLAATVEALEAELIEARLCLLAEAGDPRGADGLRGTWEPRAGGWWRLRCSGQGDALLFRQWGGGGLRARLDRGVVLVPAGLTIREAMRWVESQVLP